MSLPVYIPHWYMADVGMPPLVVGQTLAHVLSFESDSGDTSVHYGCFGRESTIVGTAYPLTGHRGGRTGAFPTALRCFSYMLYWDAPSYVEGPVTVSGIVRASDSGAAPLGFPSAFGKIDSLAVASLLYESIDSERLSWVPAPGSHQSFAAVGSYSTACSPSPDEESATSPHMRVTGVVVELDTLYRGDQPNTLTSPSEDSEGKPAPARDS